MRNPLLHCRRRARRHDARLPARARRRRCRGAGEARRLPARLPRRHGASLDARSCTSSGCSTNSSSCRTRRCRASACQIGDAALADGRLRPPADALQVHRADAAVGLPRLSSPAQAQRYPAFTCACRPKRSISSTRMEVSPACARTRRRPTRHPRRPRRRLRRPSFDRARARRAWRRGHRRADRRALVPHLAPRRGSATTSAAISRPGA